MVNIPTNTSVRIAPTLCAFARIMATPSTTVRMTVTSTNYKGLAASAFYSPTPKRYPYLQRGTHAKNGNDCLTAEPALLVNDVCHAITDVQERVMGGTEIRLILERCLIHAPSRVAQLSERLIALLNTFC
jgi:hypothetical protein